MKQSTIVIKLVASCHKKVKSRYFAIKCAINSLVCYNGPMMQGFRVIKVLESSGRYNSLSLASLGHYNKLKHL